jgi:amino acid permease
MGVIIDLGSSASLPIVTAQSELFGLTGGNPKHDRLGFRYWRNPDGPMGEYLLEEVKNTSLAIFLGFWATLTNALFAYIGTELIGVTVGEVCCPIFQEAMDFTGLF